MHRGVYRLGCAQPGRDERDMAALLGAGKGAVLSHASAAARLGLDVPPDELVHVTIPDSRRASLREAKVWRSRRLGRSEITRLGRFRLTNLPRTMIDLACILDDSSLRAAFLSAVRQDRANLLWLERALSKPAQGRRGVCRLRLLFHYLSGGRLDLELGAQPAT